MTPQAASLEPHHREMLKASAVGPDVAAARGYVSILADKPGRKMLTDLGFTRAQARVPGLLIPLWRVDGKPGGYQYKPDSPRVDKDGNVVKYEMPLGQRNVLDVPPTVQGELRKGRQAILITEGTKKADALASLGTPSINIAGVYGWRGRNKDDGLTVLPDWEEVNIKGSGFVLAFDSDILTKPQVHQALSRIKRWLESKGAAYVRVLVLPARLSGKTGVDDYIAETGSTAADLARLVVNELPEPPVADAKPKYDGPPPDLAPLLGDVVDLVRRYVVMDTHAADAVALWTAHAHAYAASETTPYLAVRSAEKRSGKTRLLEVLEFLVPKPLRTENISVAALVHSVDAGATLLLDEVDSIFKKKGAASETQEMLRGILDSGYRAGGSYVRMVGQGAAMTPKRFQTFSPKALSGIGTLPGTLDDRAIIVHLKRKARREAVAKFRIRKARTEAVPLRDALTHWAVGAIPTLAEARPDIPDELDDRAADGWEPLLAIAHMAGGDWPQRARDAALALSAGIAREDDSLGVKLLTDIRAVFDGKQAEKIASSELVAALTAMQESSWANMDKGQPLTQNSLASMLKAYEISPKGIRVGDATPRGYERNQFIDAWERYARPCSGLLSATSATSNTAQMQTQRRNTDSASKANVAGDGQIDARFNVAPVAGKTGGNGAAEQSKLPPTPADAVEV